MSTSADGEVFEWSEIGAGVFSHVVRSGLGGAADADADGRVSYAEIRAFVSTATADIRNPRYRPKLFARGPGGDDTAPIFMPRRARGRHLDVRGGERMTLRDSDDVPWLDVHAEVGVTFDVLVPTPLEHGGVQERLDPSGPGRAKVLSRTALDEGDGTRAPSAPREESADRIAARGREELFGTLFSRPFGPRAFAAEARDAGEEQHYGVSANDAARFTTLLHEVEDTDRSRRKLNAVFGALTGAVAFGTGAFIMAAQNDDASTSFGAIYVGIGAGLGIGSLITGLGSLPSEKLRLDFESDVASLGVPHAMDRAEDKLASLAKKERRGRILAGIALGITTAATASCLVVNELGSQTDLQLRGLLAANLVTEVAISALLFYPTPIERLAHTWSEDPARKPARVAVSPIGPGGPGLSLAGTF